jgi:hypothetical protein
MSNAPNPNLKMLKLWAKREIAAGRQISWTVAFATSNPTRTQIREWFDDCPQDKSKADTVEWLVRKAMKEIEK